MRKGRLKGRSSVETKSSFFPAAYIILAVMTDAPDLLAVCGFLANPRCRIQFVNFRTLEQPTHIPTRTFYSHLVRFDEVTLTGAEMSPEQQASSILFWNLTTSQETKRFSGHQRTVYSHCFLHPGETERYSQSSLMLSSSEDQSIRLWDVESVQPIAVMQGHTGGVLEVVTGKNQSGMCFSASLDGSVRMWDLEKGDCVRTRGFGDAKVQSIAIGIEDSGAEVICAATGNRIHMLSLPDLKKIHNWNPGSDIRENVMSLCWSPWKDRVLVSGDSCGNVAFTSFRKMGRIPVRTSKIHSGTIRTICPLPGRLWASGSEGNDIALWSDRGKSPTDSVRPIQVSMDAAVYGICCLEEFPVADTRGVHETVAMANFELLQSLNCVSFPLHLPNGTVIHTSRCLWGRLALGELDSPRFTSCDVQIPSETLFFALLGLPVDVRYLYPLFQLFKASGQTRRAYLMCKKVTVIEDVATLVDIACDVADSLDRSYGSYSVYLTAFGSTLLQQLHRHLKSLEDSILLLSRLPTVIESALSSLSVVKLEDHAYFDGIYSFPDSEESFLNSVGRVLLSTRQFSDVYLRTENGEVEETHLEVLVGRSNVFSKMLRFQGTEFDEVQSSRVIVINNCLHDELMELLRWIYCRSISDFGKQNLRILLRLLVFGTMYDEDLLIQLAQNEISGCVGSMSLDRFCLSLFEIGDVLSWIPDDKMRWLGALCASQWKNDTSLDGMLRSFAAIQKFRVSKIEE